MTVVVSILNWNSQDRTIACLESLKSLDSSGLMVCVTDNDSVDFDRRALEAIYEGVVIFRNNENLGFAAGHLRALEHAREVEATLFWMLNNDCLVFPETLAHLLHAHGSHGAGVYGCVSVDNKGNVNSELIWALEKGKTSTRFDVVSQNELSKGQTLRVANVVGYSLMIPMEVIAAYGFMDSSYFLYYEETDYCLQLLHKGVPSYWVGKSKVLHEEKGSSKGHPELVEVMEYYLYRNLFLFLKKHGSVRMIFHYLGRFGMRFLSANIARKQKVPPLTRKHLIGIFHAFSGRRGKFYAPEDYLSKVKDGKT